MTRWQDAASVEALHAAIADSNLPVMVKFYASGCGVCRLLDMTLSRVTPRYAGRVRFVAVNVEHAAALIEPFRLRGVPTLILFRNGREVERLEGSQTEDVLRRAIEDALTR